MCKSSRVTGSGSGSWRRRDRVYHTLLSCQSHLTTRAAGLQPEEQLAQPAQSHRLGARFIESCQKQSTKLTGGKKKNKASNIQSFQFCPFPSATGEKQPQIFNRPVMEHSPKNTCGSAAAHGTLRPPARAALGTPQLSRTAVFWLLVWVFLLCDYQVSNVQTKE